MLDHPRILKTPKRSVPLLPVVDVRGPTIQGEGPYAGHRAAIITLGGCNLTCRACDSPHTWDGSRYDLASYAPMVGVDAVIDQIVDMGRLPVDRIRLVVLTGGEPLLQQTGPALPELVGRLTLRGCAVQVETNGTIRPINVMGGDGKHKINYVVSPKLGGGLATNTQSQRINPEAIRWFAEHPSQSVFKIVCRVHEDLTRALLFANTHHIERHRIWIMGEGVTSREHQTRNRTLADHALTLGFNLSPRMHLALWPKGTNHA